MALGVPPSNPPPIPNATLPVTVSASPICPGDSVDILVANTEVNVKYQLREHITNTPIGPQLTGNGGVLSFSSGPLHSNTCFNILATDTTDATSLQLTDTAAVVVYDIPRLAAVPDTLQACPGLPINFVAQDHSLEFDGTNDFVLVGASTALTNSAAISVEAWIYANSWKANIFDGVVLCKADLGPPSGTQGWTLSTGNNGSAFFEVGPTGPTAFENASSGPIMTAGTWHHLAGTFDGNFVRLYIDGVLQATEPYVGAIQTGNSNVFIGKHSIIPGRQFDGRIDEVRIWNVALTNDQILKRIDQPLGGNEAGLLAYFDMEDGEPSLQTTDKGPSGYTGTLNSMDEFTDWVPGVFNAPASFYTWLFGDGNFSNLANPSHTYLAPGTYTVSLETTHPSGCQLTDSVDLTINPGPLVDIGPDTSICGTFSLLLDAGNFGSTYAWSNGATTQTTVYNTFGTHFVTVIDPSGCLTVDSILISSAATVPASLGPDTSICPGQTILLDPGSGFSSYNWSTGATSPTITVNDTGVVFVQVVDTNGCNSADSIYIAPGPPSPANIQGLAVSYCENDPPVQLAGLPTGGVFSGPGVTGAVFDPAQAGGPGQVQIVYQISPANQCPGTDTFLTDILPAPTASFAGLAAAYCLADPPVNLLGNPAGGIFTGPGTAGTSFDPSAAGTGSHLVTYAFTNVQGCTDTASQSTQVNQLPAVTLSGLQATYCSNDPAVLLSGLPPSGQFAGPGVTGSVFDPALSGAGNHLISYAFTDQNGCTASDTSAVTVNAAPAVSLTGLAATYCLGDPSAMLTGTPGGGVFSGPALTGNVFDPAVAGPGTYQISYAFTDALGCSDSASQNTTVNALPIVNIGGLLSVYCENSPAVAIGGSPAGGVYTGPGVVGTDFDPAGAGLGTHLISYTYSDANACTAADSFSVSVVAAPVAAFTGLAGSYCDNSAAVALVGTPAGGVFSGVGVVGNAFDPSAAGAGTGIAVIYLYQASANCSDADTQFVSVTAAPLVSLSSPEAEVCETASPFTLVGTPANGTFTGPGMVGTDFDPQAAGPATAHAIIYQFTDANGCANVDSTLIRVDSATPPALAGADVILWLDDQWSLSANAPGPGTGTWTLQTGSSGFFSDPNSPFTLLSGLPIGQSTAEWTLSNGACKSTDALTIERRPFEEARGFSPNGDPTNDTFVIEGLERYPGSKIQIFSRWGDPVYSSDDYQNDWHGLSQSGTALPDDTYFFILDVSNGKQFKGYVEIRR